jgi:membrane protein DedA with SNARE-associated domain
MSGVVFIGLIGVLIGLTVGYIWGRIAESQYYEDQAMRRIRESRNGQH